MPLHEDPLEALQTLMTKLGEMCESLGLQMQTFAVTPNPEKGQPHMAHAVMFLDPEIVFKTEEQRAEDKALKEMELHLHRDTVQDRINAAREGAAKSLAEQMGTTVEGIGLDNIPKFEVPTETPVDENLPDAAQEHPEGFPFNLDAKEFDATSGEITARHSDPVEEMSVEEMLKQMGELPDTPRPDDGV